MSNRKKSRWIARVKTDSTHPPSGLFTKSASTIARTLALRSVSPKGPASGLRMLTYFINRAGRGLTAERKAELQKAKALLSRRIERAKSLKDQREPGDSRGELRPQRKPDRVPPAGPRATSRGTGR